MKTEYVEKLAKVLKQNQPKETILVTGSRNEGRRILSLIAARGYVLVGVRAETPFSLAKELCSAWFSMEGMPHLIEEVEGAELVRGCIDKNKNIFSGVNAKTLSATRRFFRTFQEMALAEIPEEMGNHPALSSMPKLRELQEIRAAYIHQKRDRNVLDRSDLFDVALKAADPKHNADLRHAHYVVLGDYIPNLKERKLLELLAEENGLTVVDLPCAEETEIPEGAMAKELPRVNAVETVRKADPRLVSCRGVETEVRFPFRDILDKQLALEDCAIVYLSGSYAQPLYEEAGRFGIPVTMGGGIPMTGSLLYTTLKQVANLPQTDFYAEDTCALLESFSCTPMWPVKLAERMRQKKIGWDKTRYPLVWDPEDVQKVRPEDMTDEAWDLMVHDWERFLRLLVSVAAPEGDLEQQQKDVLEFLTYCNHKSAVEGAAFAKARELIEHVVGLDENETLLERLLGLMETSSFFNGKTEPGTLYCAPLYQAACTGRKYLYVLGFSRYAVQGRRKESPILLDKERESLGGLKTSAQLGREQEFRLLTLLARHDGELVLTFPDFESSKMLDQQPAPFFQELSRGILVEKVTYLAKNHRIAVDQMIGNTTIDSVRENGLWDLGDGDKIKLIDQKSKKEILEGLTYSPSGLEAALSCPYKFYMKYVLKIRVPQAVERDPEVWLNAMDIGNFCHKVLEEYYKAEEKELLDSVFEREFKALEKEIPIPHPSLKQESRTMLKEMVERAVDWTEQNGRTVVATEKTFGKDSEVKLPFGKWTISLQGSIDRVDDLGNGEYAILDYKTGRPENYTEEMHRHWQHYLYTVAEEKLSPKTRKIKRAGYLFLKEEAKLVELEENQDLRDETAARIEWLLDRISEESYKPECQPCYQPVGALPNGQMPKPRLLEPGLSSKDVLQRCKKTCEFAMICPKQKGGG